MYTGIVQGCFSVVELVENENLKTFVVELNEDLVAGLQIGASVALNGVCLTVTKIDGVRVSFDAMLETLEKTNLGDVKEHDCVNVERSAKMGDEIGGHVMSGHIIGKAEIVNIENPENNHVVTFKVVPELMKYIFDKGFVGLDGASLTVVDPDKDGGTFNVWLIPETLRQTAYGNRAVGDFVNVELDSRTQTIVDTVEAFMQQKNN